MTDDLYISALIPTHPAPPVLDSSDVQVRWVMPEIFHDLPVTEKSDDEAIRQIEELTDKAFPGVDDESKTWFAVLCALGVEEMRSMHAEYSSFCIIPIDGKPCSATVFVTLIDSIENNEGSSPSSATASALRQTATGEISEIELPCGSAVSHIGTHEVRILGDMEPSGRATSLPTYFIRVYLPLPNETTLVMELGTPNMEGWDTFSTIFGNVVSSIRLFYADGSPVPPGKIYS